MREIDVGLVSKTIEKLCIEANCALPCDVKKSILDFTETEVSPIAKQILKDIKENFEIAEKENMPICQDTGMALVFLKIGQDVHFVGGSLNDAVNEGVRKGYKKGYLRKSVVSDPIERINTNDNTPAMIYTEIVDGENVEITVAPKGFGSENMSAVKMLKPSDSLEGVVNFVLLFNRVRPFEAVDFSILATGFSLVKLYINVFELILCIFAILLQVSINL